MAFDLLDPPGDARNGRRDRFDRLITGDISALVEEDSGLEVEDVSLVVVSEVVVFGDSNEPVLADVPNPSRVAGRLVEQVVSVFDGDSAVEERPPNLPAHGAIDE